jgi:hypothetical protein
MSARAMVATRTGFRAISRPRTITLLELVSELTESSANDREVVDSVMDLLSRRRVHLIGQVVARDLLDH